MSVTGESPADAEKNDSRKLANHFEFGANWRRFLERVDEQRIDAAASSLRHLLFGREANASQQLDGVRFLDAGCGSGLFSLAAHRLGADVSAFDFDPQSVACAQELQSRFAEPNAWPVVEGSVLDRDFLESIGRFDVVYSWGVLHHTGAMWDAIDAITNAVAEGGTLVIAIYNEQGRASRRWRGVKTVYQQLPSLLRTPYVATIGAGYFGYRAIGKIAETIASPLERRASRIAPVERSNALSEAVQRSDSRGMTRWYDLVDWVGGWPYETGRPEEIVDFLFSRGFTLKRLRTVGGNHGCNEFVFRRVASAGTGPQT